MQLVSIHDMGSKQFIKEAFELTKSIFISYMLAPSRIRVYILTNLLRADSSLLDIRNTRQLKGPLTQLRLIHRPITVVRVILAITLGHIGTSVHSIGPVSSTNPTFKRILLADQVLLRSIRNRHVASVDSETGLVVLGAEVVVGSARVPDQQIARLGAELLPLAAVLLEPLHAAVGEAVPFGGPGGDALFVGHVAVEFFGDEVAALADDETAVVRAVGEQVHETLHAAEAVLLGVLVLVRPGLVGGDIGATVLA